MSIQNPLFAPPSEWVCPERIDYKGQTPVAIDLETCDPGIKDHGPGWATGKGKVVQDNLGRPAQIDIGNLEVLLADITEAQISYSRWQRIEEELGTLSYRKKK